MNPLVDTHNHLFDPELSNNLEAVVNPAIDAGLFQMLVCGGDVETSFMSLQMAEKINSGFAIGLHPLFVAEDAFEELERVEGFIAQHKDNRLFCAIGEIGLDGSENAISGLNVQEEIFRKQLKIAGRYDLPVSIHARGAIDLVCKALKRISVPGGVVHAFNGSKNQADRLMAMGFKLGFGGAMAYDGSLRIRRTLSEIDSTAYVLETDCPDMPSQWRRDQNPENPMSFPIDMKDYAQEAAKLRSQSYQEICAQSTANALAVFPKLKALGSLKKVMP